MIGHKRPGQREKCGTFKMGKLKFNNIVYEKQILQTFTNVLNNH